MRIMAEGASVTYSADTGECPALVDLARDIDLLLCEAAFREGPGQPRGPPPHRPSGRRACGQGRRPQAGPDPHPALDRQADQPGRCHRRVRRADRLAHAGGIYEL